MGCGLIYQQEKDSYFSDGGQRWVELKSKCGETFDESGIDLCKKCVSSEVSE